MRTPPQVPTRPIFTAVRRECGARNSRPATSCSRERRISARCHTTIANVGARPPKILRRFLGGTVSSPGSVGHPILPGRGAPIAPPARLRDQLSRKYPGRVCLALANHFTNAGTAPGCHGARFCFSLAEYRSRDQSCLDLGPPEETSAVRITSSFHCPRTIDEVTISCQRYSNAWSAGSITAKTGALPSRPACAAVPSTGRWWLSGRVKRHRRRGCGDEASPPARADDRGQRTVQLCRHIRGHACIDPAGCAEQRFAGIPAGCRGDLLA